jgi:hypothetical protein
MSTQFEQNTTQTPVDSGAAILDVSTGNEAPAGGAEAQQEATAAADSSGGDKGGSQAATPAFEVPETDDDLSGQEHQPWYQNLVEMRKGYRELNLRHKAVSGYQPLTELGSPEEVKLYADLGRGLFSQVDGEVGEFGLPRTTSVPMLERLNQESPTSFDRLVTETLQFQIDGEPVINHVIRELGLKPENLARYREWEEKGVLAASQDGGNVSAEDLKAIPAEYHDVFKQLPAKYRDELVLMDDDLRDYNLKREKRIFDQEQAERATAETRDREAAEARERTAAAFETQVDSYKNERFQSAYAAVKQTLASQLKLSADQATNGFHAAALMSQLVNMTDPRMDFENSHVLTSIGLQPEQTLKTLRAAQESWEGAARNVKMAEASQDKIAIQRTRAQEQTLYTQLLAHYNGVAAVMSRALASGVLARVQQQNEQINDALTAARPAIGDTSASPRGVGSLFRLPPNVMPGSAEADELAASQWATR